MRDKIGNGDNGDGWIDDPRGNSYQQEGFIKNKVGDTLVFEKTRSNYFLTFGTPVEKIEVYPDNPTRVRSFRTKRDDDDILHDGIEPHPLTHLYNIYSRFLLERKAHGRKFKFKGKGRKRRRNLAKMTRDDWIQCGKKAKRKHLRFLLRCARREILKNDALVDALWDDYMA